MSGIDNERLLPFKNRIKELELQLSDKETILQQYEAMGNAADQKIQALNGIQDQKVRSLMNSIQLLRKENAQLKQQGKEHKRSQLIEQLNQEIKDQDLVISTLRSLVNDETKCDMAIVKALNAGPPKIKVLSREELKIENKKLNNQILTMKQKGVGGKPGVGDSQVSSASTQPSVKALKFEDTVKLNNQEQLNQRIQQLQAECDDSKQQLIEQMEKNRQYSDEISKKDIQISEMRSAKLELVVLNKKYEALQREIDKYRGDKVGKEVFKMNDELQMEEMQIINRAQGGKLQLAEKNLRSELDSMQMKAEQANHEREEMQQEYAKVLVRYNDLNKRFNDLQKKLMESREEINKIKKEQDTKTAYYEKQIQDLLACQSLLEQEVSEKTSALVAANLRVEALAKDNEELTEGLREFGTQLQGLKSPDSDEVQINQQIQDLLRKHSKGGAEQDKLKEQLEQKDELIKKLMKQLMIANERYERNVDNMSSDISKLISQHGGADIDDVNSDISGMMSQENQKKFYANNLGLLQNNRIRRMSSGIEGMMDSQKAQSEEYRDFDSQVSVTGTILQGDNEKMQNAPKRNPFIHYCSKATRKDQYKEVMHVSQMDSSVGSMISKSQQNHPQFNDMSSNVSGMSLQSKRSSVINKSQLSKVSSNVSSVKDVGVHNANDISSDVSMQLRSRQLSIKKK